MNKKTPALGKQGQGLEKVCCEPDSSKNHHKLHTYKNAKQVLDELARKWVRYGCAETPNEALRMLLGGVK